MTKSKFIRNLSIKTKIVLIIVSILILLQTIGFIFVSIWTINLIENEAENGLVLNTKLVTDNCIVPLIFDDDKQATIALSYLNNIDVIEIACLFDSQGNVFATYPETLNKNDFPVFDEEVMRGLVKGYFYINEPVMYKNERYGTLYIKANTEPLNKSKKITILTLLLLGVALDILAIFLAIRLQRFISKPIIDLKDHFNSIADNNDYSARIIKQNNDEVGQLYDEFNDLLSQIQNRSIGRDNAENHLKESQEKLNLALQGGDIGIWEWDFESDITIWDSKMEKMFGLNEGTFNQTYEAFKECLYPDDIVLAENAIQNAINDVAPYDIIYRVLWRNKQIKYIRAKALVSKDNQQKPFKMIGVCFDVTDIKEAENELKIHRENLENLVQERTAKLESKNDELESFNQIFIDREFRIKELRDELDIIKSSKEN